MLPQPRTTTKTADCALSIPNFSITSEGPAERAERPDFPHDFAVTHMFHWVRYHLYTDRRTQSFETGGRVPCECPRNDRTALLGPRERQLLILETTCEMGGYNHTIEVVTLGARRRLVSPYHDQKTDVFQMSSSVSGGKNLWAHESFSCALLHK